MQFVLFKKCRFPSIHNKVKKKKIESHMRGLVVRAGGQVSRFAKVAGLNFYVFSKNEIH